MTRRPHRLVKSVDPETNSKEIHYTSIGLLDRLKMDLPALESSEVRFEDFLYVNVPEEKVRAVYGKFKRFASIHRLTHRRTADCDNWATWLWSYMTMQHAKREDTLAESVAFGVFKFRLSARPQYGDNPHGGRPFPLVRPAPRNSS